MDLWNMSDVPHGMHYLDRAHRWSFLAPYNTKNSPEFDVVNTLVPLKLLYNTCAMCLRKKWSNSYDLFCCFCLTVPISS